MQNSTDTNTLVDSPHTHECPLKGGACGYSSLAMNQMHNHHPELQIQRFKNTFFRNKPQISLLAELGHNRESFFCCYNAVLDSDISRSKMLKSKQKLHYKLLKIKK